MVRERSGRVGRRLAAIMAADVVGYSRLMHDDEEGTHARLTALLAVIVEPAIAEHGGRVVKHTGDGFLADFPSAVEAVRAARHFQDRVREHTASEAEDRRLVFRVGINIGDVIVEEHDIFGDGVNIAARLEGIAEPSGICISSSAYEQVRGKIPIDVIDLGERNLKNISRPVRAYAVVDNEPGSLRRVGVPAETSPPSLSLVVLPFTNMGGDPEQEYFVDGVTETLTTDLSRISGAFVIGRHTAFTFKGKSVDLKAIGRELNVRYVLEGSVQRGGGRIRVNVQLIDAQTGNHLWADRFDKPVVDLFDMQDEIVSRLANSLGNQLTEAEARRAERALHPDATDFHFRGRACLFKGLTKDYLAQARGFFERALTLDPNFIKALVGTAIVDITISASYPKESALKYLETAEATLLKVLSQSPEDAEAHVFLGVVYILTNRAARGIAECNQALTLNRNLAEAHALIGWAQFLLGRSEETEIHIREALRISPRDTYAFQWMGFVGVAKLQLGADEEAVAWLRRSIEANRNLPQTHFHLAAALALLGELNDARDAAKAGLSVDPDFTIRRFRAGAYSSNPVYLAKRERIYEGLRMAGLRED
jgi:TolB-like protein/class 3 adenylate cyclase/tetratricopeptide (TPR) repeat protein